MSGSVTIVHRYQCACGKVAECEPRRPAIGWWVVQCDSAAAVPCCSKACVLVELTRTVNAQPPDTHAEFHITRAADVGFADTIDFVSPEAE